MDGFSCGFPWPLCRVLGPRGYAKIQMRLWGSCTSNPVRYSPEKLTNVPWKSLVGRCIPYWNGHFLLFRGHVSFRGCISFLNVVVFWWVYLGWNFQKMHRHLCHLGCHFMGLSAYCTSGIPNSFGDVNVKCGGGEIHPVLKLLFQTNATSEEGKLTGHDYRSRETTKRFEGHLSWLVNLPPPEIMV